MTAIDFDHSDFTSLATRALVLYSLAEFQGGHASTIRVDAGGATFSVADDGRGHAIHRLISGRPYLPFIYTQLDYPFTDATQTGAGDVQLHGIGMSLLNSLCSELNVVVRKRDGTLRLAYANGTLLSETSDENTNEATGTSVSGTIHPTLRSSPVDVAAMKRGLARIVALHPALKLRLNDEEVNAGLVDFWKAWTQSAPGCSPTRTALIQTHLRNLRQKTR